MLLPSAGTKHSMKKFDVCRIVRPNIFLSKTNQMHSISNLFYFVRDKINLRHCASGWFSKKHCMKKFDVCRNVRRNIFLSKPTRCTLSQIYFILSEIK